MNNLKTYGKISLFNKVKLSLIERFKSNKNRTELLQNYGVNTYLPKINKVRASIGLLGVVVCVVVPLITPLLVFPLLWGSK